MRITRSDVIKNRLTHIYVYADDKTCKAYRGMAETFTGLSNCYPIWTRIWCCSSPAAQWTILPLEDFKAVLQRNCFEPILQTLKAAPQKTLVVVPKIGCGCSGLKWSAPQYYAIIEDFLESIQAK